MCKWRGKPVCETFLRLTDLSIGLDRNLCRAVACHRGEDSEAYHQRQDVLRTMPGNRPVLEKAESRAERVNEGVKMAVEFAAQNGW
jgi:hypothetical protein